jgi:hypothetical protein
MAKTAHHPILSALFRGEKQCRISAAMVLLLVVFQFLSVLHFYIVPHAVDARTGKVIHVHERTRGNDSSSGTQDDSSPEPVSSDEICHIYALLHSVKALNLSGIIMPQRGSFSEVSVVTPNLPIVRQKELYRLSPSHSPPFRSMR